MKNITFVTCIYDLAKRGHASHRTVDWMFAHSAYVMNLPYPLVVFCDPELADEVRKRRGDRNTICVTMPYEDLYITSGCRDAIRAAIRAAKLQDNARRDKVTPAYVELMWAKYAMLDEMIVDTDVVGDRRDAIGWIDFAITHVAKPAPYEVFEGPDYNDHKVRVHAMRLFDRAYVRSCGDYFANVHGHLSGGLVVGHPRDVDHVVSAFFETAQIALKRGRAVLDEGLLSYFASYKPHWFSFSYGDYCDILTNFGKVRTGKDHLRWMLDTAMGDHQDTTDLERAMREGDMI
jgi:hypothetical protein